jgi:pimeloyl-ACP methyl ester carboxylesterase
MFEKPSTSPENTEPVNREEKSVVEKLVKAFDRPKQMNIYGQNFDVVDIQPETLKTSTPTIYVPGFSATPEALKDPIIRMAEAGRRVISAYAPHGVKGELEHESLPKIEAQKLDLFLQLIEYKKLGKVNVVANSEASLYVVIAATLFPEKFENIVLVDPAGLIGKDGAFQLLQRVVEDMKKEGQLKGNLPQSVRPSEFPSPRSVGMKSILSNVKASIQEIQAISTADIADALREIHTNGIGVSIIHGADDRIFPMERLQEMVTSDMVSGFYSVAGSHNSIYQYEPYERAVEAALTALEKRSRKVEHVGWRDFMKKILRILLGR